MSACCFDGGRPWRAVALSDYQARAAKLLHIKPTTLNSKIKLYGIEY